MTIADDVLRAKKDIDDAFNAGKKSEYDTFWDTYQNNGNRGNYNYAFYNQFWNDNTFLPKYDIKPQGGSNRLQSMFYSSGITDLKSILERNGVYIDLTEYDGSTGLAATFEGSAITHIGRIKYPEYVKQYAYTFSGCTDLHTIDEVHLSPDGSTVWQSNVLSNCRSLVNITITGVIGQNDFDIHWSTQLSQASIYSITDSLSPTTSGLTVTLSKAAVDTAFSEGDVIGSESQGWQQVIDYRDNWTIALI